MDINFYLCFVSKMLFFRACKGGNEARVKYLVEHGININKDLFTNEPLLFETCSNGNEFVVKCLVEH